MKTSLFTLVFSIAIPTGLLAQQNSVSAGGDVSGSGGTVSFSVGQIDYLSITGAGGSVAQGVQQPYMGGCAEAAPVVTGFTNVSHHGTTVQWSSPVLQAGSKFIVRYHKFGDSPNFGYKIVSNPATNSAYVGGLDANTQYVFRVGARCASETMANFSDTASVWTKKYCAPPIGMAADAGLDTTILSWDDVGADLYKVRFRETGGNWRFRSRVDTSVVIDDLQPGVDYEWKVRSVCNAGGNRPYTDLQFFSTPFVRLAQQISVSGFRVFPNPTASHLTVEFIDVAESEVTLDLRDMSGRVVYNRNMVTTKGDNRTTLDMAELANGFYVLRAITKAGNILFNQKVGKN